VPFAPADNSMPLTVAVYNVTLEPLPSYAVVGGEVRFEGRLTVDGKPAPNETVKIKFCPYEAPELCADLLTLKTGSMGEFYTIWKPTHDMACKTYYFYAEHEASGVRSGFQAMSIAYPVRISISAPSRVIAGQGFDVSGKLEFEASPGVWIGLRNRRVKVYCDGSKIAETTTLSDGSYSTRVSISKPGTYTLRAVFEGEFPYTYAYTGKRLYAALLGHSPVLGVAGASLIAVALYAARRKRRA